MPEIIEISEDSRDHENAELDIYVIDDRLDSNDSNQQANYPSSPRGNVDAENIEIIESTSCSSEIVVPFCHELSSTTPDDSSSFQIPCKEEEDSGDMPNGKSHDKLLDKIIDGNSSLDLSVEKNEEKSVTSLRDLAPKWSKDNSKPPNSTKAEKPSEFTLVGLSQDVFADFPLSSPVAEKSAQLADINWMLPANNKGDELNPRQGELGATRSVTNTQIDRVNYYQSKDKIQESRELSLPYERPNTVELKLSKFLSDKTWENKPPSSRRMESNIIKHSKNNMPSVVSSNQGLGKRALHQYILRGEYYSRQKSESLLRYWLKEDKRKLKQVNQIYRSNESARSSIIIEISSGLLESLQETAAKIESLISPATLQIGYDDYLPRIRFLRRTTSIYDFNHDIYYPSDLRIMEENVNILVYDAQRFFEHYRNEKRKLFDVIQSFSKNKKYLIVVLSDLNKLKRSMESLEEIEYKTRVREQLTGSQVTSTRSKKIKAVQNLKMKTFDLEQRLRHIDRLWNVRLHVVNSTMEFINTLPNLVSIIGRQRMDPAIRFMKYSHIHVRSSKDRTDVLKKTLHHLNKMPELKCNAVTNAYPDFQSLFDDFNKNQLKSGLDGKHLMTEAMERRLHKLFTCRDPNETIQ